MDIRKVFTQYYLLTMEMYYTESFVFYNIYPLSTIFGANSHYNQN